MIKRFPTRRLDELPPQIGEFVYGSNVSAAGFGRNWWRKSVRFSVVGLDRNLFFFFPFVSSRLAALHFSTLSSSLSSGLCPQAINQPSRHRRCRISKSKRKEVWQEAVQAKKNGEKREKMCEKITIGVYVSNRSPFHRDSERSEKPKLPTEV